MNVLVDRHHAGLLYSLQLLFEDRLGCELYVPIGHEWWDEKYWRFGTVFGDDRLAKQYLDPGTPEMYDVEFPERLIRGVTLADARKMDWAYVVASVQENQRGLARFAREVGGKHVYQVGNRGQQVDWDLNPVALVSAEAPIPKGVRAAVYHQEYAKDTTFAYRPLTHAGAVASFVNCFDRMPDQWKSFQRAEQLAPEFTWDVYGHDGRSGLVQPTTAIADTMATYGFAWHDKPQGDGFGHVIHYWASIGRPLIGHGSYYEGLMPGPLWEDGVTCIDLSLRSIPDAVKMMREIRDDRERHETMCRAIRERVDALVDFDAEEALIRSALEG